MKARYTASHERKGLTNLTYLSLSNNQISDIQPLQGLINLTRLDLDNNQTLAIFN